MSSRRTYTVIEWVFGSAAYCVLIGAGVGWKEITAFIVLHAISRTAKEFAKEQP